MIKSNAYGHGLIEVAQCLEGYTDLFGVRSLEEAFILVENKIKTPLLLAQGIRNPYELIEASKHNFQVVIHTYEHIEWLNSLTLAHPIVCWLKINTGMGRLGFDPIHTDFLYTQLTSNTRNVKDVILMSHFACAENKDHPLNTTQIETFKTHTEQLSSPRSMSNSAAIFNFPECHFEYVRPGIALYGISPIPEKTKELGLKPVMTFYSSLLCVKTLPKGASVGYSARYFCPETMLIGIIGCGYADGYPLTIDENTPVLIKDTVCPIIGKISMDMIAVDLRNVPTAKIGDSVIMWGENLPLETIVPHTAQSSYTILAGMVHNVPSEWIL